ncbi:MAG: hypothetical protein JWM62_1403, partial [Frankiales bacterium]|nr:hypothetical protein [Frankiales bacterium]
MASDARSGTAVPAAPVDPAPAVPPAPRAEDVLPTADSAVPPDGPVAT